MSSARGFTLLELLAAVSLVALVAGVVSVRVTSGGDGADVREAAARIRALDARARLFAQTIGQVELALDRDRERVELRLTDRDSVALARRRGELLRRVELPGQVRARLRSVHSVDSIVFQRDGTSADYEVELRAGATTLRWTQLGLTGWPRAEDDR